VLRRKTEGARVFGEVLEVDGEPVLAHGAERAVALRRTLQRLQLALAHAADDEALDVVRHAGDGECAVPGVRHLARDVGDVLERIDHARGGCVAALRELAQRGTRVAVEDRLRPSIASCGPRAGAGCRCSRGQRTRRSVRIDAGQRATRGGGLELEAHDGAPELEGGSSFERSAQECCPARQLTRGLRARGAQAGAVGARHAGSGKGGAIVHGRWGGLHATTAYRVWERPMAARSGIACSRVSSLQ
jgi:hypothetical protein